REKVNLGAALVVMSVAAARRLGVPADRWVFLHGHADLRERHLLDRRDLGAAPAHVAAARHALEVAGIGVDQGPLLVLPDRGAGRGGRPRPARRRSPRTHPHWRSAL